MRPWLAPRVAMRQTPVCSGTGVAVGDASVCRVAAVSTTTREFGLSVGPHPFRRAVTGFRAGGVPSAVSTPYSCTARVCGCSGAQLAGGLGAGCAGRDPAAGSRRRSQRRTGLVPLCLQFRSDRWPLIVNGVSSSYLRPQLAQVGSCLIVWNGSQASQREAAPKAVGRQLPNRYIEIRMSVSDPVPPDGATLRTPAVIPR
jgi:hypothetical protein